MKSDINNSGYPFITSNRITSSETATTGNSGRIYLFQNYPNTFYANTIIVYKTQQPKGLLKRGEYYENK